MSPGDDPSLDPGVVPLAPQRIEAVVDRCVRTTTAELDALLRQAPRRYEDLAGPLESLLEPVRRLAATLDWQGAGMASALCSPALDQHRPRLDALLARVHSEPQLLARVSDVLHTAELTAEQRRHLEVIAREARRAGAALSASDRPALEQLDRELAAATRAFGDNVHRASSAVDPAWRSIVTEADDASLRRAAYRARTQRCWGGPHDNRALVRTIVALRARRAQLLGADSFADLVLPGRMLDSVARVRAVLDALRCGLGPLMHAEHGQLVRWTRNHRPDLSGLQVWDLAYAARCRRRTIEPSERGVSLDDLLGQIVVLFEDVFGFRVHSHADLRTWHPSVRVLDLHGEPGLLARVFIDLERRPEKRRGCWMHPLVVGGPTPDGFEPHRAILVADLDAGAPVGREAQRRVLHELGHLLHLVCSEVEPRGLAGTRVPLDLVELPAIVLEGATAPSESLDHRRATTSMRQLGWARVDLVLHTDPPSDPFAMARHVLAAHLPVALPDDDGSLANFEHLFVHPTGYAGGYHAYVWAEVLAAELQAVGPRDRSARGSWLRRGLLARGNTWDPGALLHDLLGRAPGADARAANLLRRLADAVRRGDDG